MNQKELFSFLRKNLKDDYISFKEYQDKYFLSKKIQQIIPSFTRSDILDALNKFSKEKSVMNPKNSFLKTFTNNLFRSIDNNAGDSASPNKGRSKLLH